MNVVERKKDGVEKIRYLIIALNSYNKFLKRNLGLEFDNARVCSRIVSSNDKNQTLNSVVTSFKTNDKLNPINCLSSIGNLPSAEQFLTQKQLSTRIKDMATFLAAVVPVMITILQLLFQYFQPLQIPVQ
jgi:hypothetical protein